MKSSDHDGCHMNMCESHSKGAALIITLHKLYDDSGDAESYGLALALSSCSGVATINLLSVVLDLLAKLNCFMQRKAIDLSRLPIILKRIVFSRALYLS